MASLITVKKDDSFVVSPTGSIYILSIVPFVIEKESEKDLYSIYYVANVLDCLTIRYIYMKSTIRVANEEEAKKIETSSYYIANVISGHHKDRYEELKRYQKADNTYIIDFRFYILDNNRFVSTYLYLPLIGGSYEITEANVNISMFVKCCMFLQYILGGNINEQTFKIFSDTKYEFAKFYYVQDIVNNVNCIHGSDVHLHYYMITDPEGASFVSTSITKNMADFEGYSFRDTIPYADYQARYKNDQIINTIFRCDGYVFIYYSKTNLILICPEQMVLKKTHIFTIKR